QHWQLHPEDILNGSLSTGELFSNPRISREAKVHLAIYRRFPDANGVIHAHALHILPFASACKPIIPMLEQTEKFGVIEPVSAAPAHSQELAENVVAGLSGKELIIQKQAAAVLLPRHGIIVAGKDLLAAADALERIDWNAYCLLAARWLE
ncbi:MAG: class II aldolase/adducin family protein, partial [Omnitrophica WOR_2 bacterium]